ncbi:MAG: hypothetical protein J4400_01915 [Candidatus Aenigmarchaeota archaeon]|nr:hypothetical protein [Candidatus Aenigmarchaeota archaeon]
MTTLEIVQFRLKSETDEKDFISAAEELQKEFLGKAAGFIDRALARTEDGNWMDVLHWETPEDAQRVAKDFLNHASARRYEDMIDLETAKMTDSSVVRKF